MATVFKFKADGSGYSRGINQMRDQTKRFAGSVKGMLAGAFAFAGIGGAIAGIKTLFKEMDRLHKLSLRYNMSAEVVQKLGFAAEQSGSSLEVVAKGLLQANRAAVEASAGLKSYQRGFEDLNIDYNEFAKLDQEQQFRKIADAVKNTTDQNKALAAAQTILGRAGAELIPLLKQGSDGYDDLTGSLTTYTDAQVAAAAATNDAINRTVTEVKTSIGKAIIGAMQAFEYFVTVGTQAAIELSNVWKEFGKLLIAVFSRNAIGMKKAYEEMEAKAKGALDRIAQAGNEILDEQLAKEKDAKKKALAEISTEATKEAQDTADKIAKIEEKIAQEKRKRDEAAMTTAQKLEESTKRRLALEEELSNIDPFQDSVEKSEKTLELEKARTEEIKLQKKAEKEKEEANKKIAEMAKAVAEIAKEAAEKEKAKNEEIAAIKGDIAEEKDIRSEIGMTDEELAAKATRERKKLEQELANIKKGGGDPLEIAKKELEVEEKKTEEASLLNNIAGAANTPESAAASNPSIIASSLAAIGGGGGTAMFNNDPILNENKRQTELLDDIRIALQGASGLDSSGGLKIPEL